MKLSLRNANLFYLFFLTIGLIVLHSILTFVFNLVINTSNPILKPLTMSCLWGISILLYVVISKQKPKILFPIKKPSLRLTLAAIFSGVFLLPIVIIIDGLIKAFIPSGLFDQALGEMSGFSVVWIVIAFAVVPAIFEELFFRGIIFTNYANSSLKYAIIISSLYFGFIHFNLAQLTYSFIAGIAFALLRYYSGSILMPILSHFTLNFLSVSGLYANFIGLLGDYAGMFLLISPLISILFLYLLFKYLAKKDGDFAREDYAIIKENCTDKKEKKVSVLFITNILN